MIAGDRFRPNIIGIPWCREEEYDAFRAIFEDAKDLPPDWKAFADAAQQAEEFHKQQGYIVKRVYIDPRTFPEWCQTQGYGVNAQARARFAERTVNTNSNST